MIRIYTLTAGQAAALGTHAVRTCLPSRYARACRMRNEKDRLLSLAAGHLLLGPLGIPGEEVLTEGPYGKPAAAGFPPFSLSHSGTCAVLAVNTDAPSHTGTAFREISLPHAPDAAAGTPVGVDLELLRPAPVSRMQGLLLPEEYAWVQAPSEDPAPGDPAARFFTLWTLKESVLKAVGTGIHRDPRKLDVLPLLQGGTIHFEGCTLAAVSCLADGYALSVCFSPADPAAGITRLRSSLRILPETAL